MYKVVIIDDNKVLADSLAAQPIWNDTNGIVVQVCYDSVTGKDAISRHMPELIITDIRLPGMNGLDLIQTVRETAQKARIIFISAYDEFQYAQRAIRLGAEDYLLKPFSQKAMEQAVYHAIQAMNETDGAQTEDDAANLLIKPILAWVEEHLEQHITADMVAAEFYMSTSKLNKLLRKYNEKGFRETRMELRVKKAKAMLRDVRYSIDDIAKQTGFQSYASFYRAFVRVFTISPTKYRDSSQCEIWDEHETAS